MKDAKSIREELGLEARQAGGFAESWLGGGPDIEVVSPVDGASLGTVRSVSREDLDRILARSAEAFLSWRDVPAPRRGAVVRALGSLLRRHKEALAGLVTLEMGKPLGEALGEVQEMIDMCDFAVGLSRQLHGLTLPSERAGHRIQEQWHPLGPCAVVTAFNFPVAVWSWNAALALVCGDTVVWKPSSRTPWTAAACVRLAHRALAEQGFPPDVCALAAGRGSEVGDALVADPRMRLVSFTGSVARGRRVGALVQERFGRSLLELGGNNAVIVSRRADLELALRAVYFGAVGTAGQRCTTTRRVLVHEAVYDRFRDALVAAYEKTEPADPRLPSTLMGPLVSREAVETLVAARKTVVEQGGSILAGGEPLSLPGGCYATPCLAASEPGMPVVREEIFAPLLHLMAYRKLEDAIAVQNDVPQGLSSAIITEDFREAETFLGAAGSDCGIANVNAGTSGAEIGGAFGGEKQTGGGRESGSDAWKAYMRRQTQTLNFSGGMELAQSISFSM